MYKTILVPIDLGHLDQGSKMLGIARQIGGEGSRVVALYVTADIPGFAAAEMPADLLRNNLIRSRDELRALAVKAGAESVIRSGHPSTKILECIDEIGADLVVMASHRPGLQDYFLGSTAARVVRHAPCAVFVDR